MNIAVDCGVPKSISNGAVAYSSTKLASMASYSCDSGYSLVGNSSTTTCSEKGVWEGPLPTCVGKQTHVHVYS